MDKHALIECCQNPGGNGQGSFAICTKSAFAGNGWVLRLHAYIQPLQYCSDEWKPLCAALGGDDPHLTFPTKHPGACMNTEQV